MCELHMCEGMIRDEDMLPGRQNCGRKQLGLINSISFFSEIPEDWISKSSSTLDRNNLIKYMQVNVGRNDTLFLRQNFQNNCKPLIRSFPFEFVKRERR